MKIQAFSHPCISQFTDVLPRHKFAPLKQNKFTLNLSRVLAGAHKIITQERKNTFDQFQKAV